MSDLSDLDVHNIGDIDKLEYGESDSEYETQQYIARNLMLGIFDDETRFAIETLNLLIAKTNNYLINRKIANIKLKMMRDDLLIKTRKRRCK
jgi:hypothetical protein